MGEALSALLRKELREHLKTRRFMVVSFILFGAALALAIYYGKHGGVDALASSDLFWILFSMTVPLLALLLGYDAIVGERARGTLSLLLSRPPSRSLIFGGKFLFLFLFVGAVLFGAGALAYWLCAAVSGTLPPHSTTDGVFKSYLVEYFAATCWLAFSLFFSARMRSPALCLITVLLLWLLAIPMISRMPLGIYIGRHGGPEQVTAIPLWAKALYAISPDSCAQELVTRYIANAPAIKAQILPFEWCIGAMLLFLGSFLLSSFLSFRKLSLE